MKIAISRTDGGVSIMTLLDEARQDEAIRKWQDVNPGQYVSHREVSEDEIPTDRASRNALTDTGTEIRVRS